MIEKPKQFGIKLPFLIAIIILLVFSYLSYFRINAVIENSELVNHTNRVKLSLEEAFTTLSEKESNHRGYIFTNDSVFLLSYFEADNNINSALNTIDSLTKYDPSQQQNAIALRTAINKRLARMKQNLALFQGSNVSIVDRLKGKALMDTVRAQMDIMRGEQDAMLSARSAAFSKSASVTPLLTLVLIIGSTSILITAYFRIVRDQKRSNVLTSKVEQRTNELFQINKELALENEEKEKRTVELVVANKELESFNYISSHDLQEPLRKIQAFASRLVAEESQNLSVKGKDYVSRMEAAANRMQGLIADLLAYSRTTSAVGKLETTNLNTIIESVINDFADTIAEKKAIIEVLEMCDAPIIPFQFRQLMDNIIGNALKFAKPDLPSHIIIKSRIIKGSKVNNENLLSEKEYCHITVTDNGIGFAPEYKDHIFELFKRLHDNEKIKGTGIGL